MIDVEDAMPACDEPMTIRPAPYYKEYALARAERRRALILPIIEQGPPYYPTICKVAQQSGLSTTTLYNSIKRFEASGDLRSLTRRECRRSFRVSAEALEIIATLFNERFVKMPGMSHARFALEARIIGKTSEVQMPHTNTIKLHLRRLIGERSARDVARTRGKKRAAEALTLRTGKFSVQFPLDVYEMDHTALDVHIVDEISRETIGRPYLTIALDVSTRMVAGVYLSLDPVSANSVGQCLFNAISPKDAYLRELGIPTTWPIQGVPRVLHTDNARDFLSKSVERFCRMMNIRKENRPVGAPRYGGHVERVIGTINRHLHSLPGTTFSSVAERQEYKAEKFACLTLSELERIIIEFITGTYHQRVHSTTGSVPEKAYYDALLSGPDSFGIGQPRQLDERRLRLDLLPSKSCTVQRYGVTIDGFVYVGEALAAYVGSKGEDGRTKYFDVAYDPRCINDVYLYAEDVNEYFTLSLRDAFRPRISKWEAQRARARERKDGGATNEAAIFASHERQQAIVDEAAATTLGARRERARRVRGKPLVVENMASGDPASINWDEEVQGFDGAALI